MFTIFHVDVPVSLYLELQLLF